jgi:hypothetical protein
LPFVDVGLSDWFYEYVQYLYCDGVINGYVTEPPCDAGTPCFKPANPTTRGQMAKIVVLAFAFPIDVSAGPSFEDVAEGSTFYSYIETARSLGLVNGYECGRLGEPCDPYNRPYYHPERDVTRGQITKIVVAAAIIADPVNWTLLNPAESTFQDVAAGSTFFQYVETAAAHGVINGYPCGPAPAGVCVPPDNKPYFLPNADATRAQISKVVYLAVTTSAPR